MRISKEITYHSATLVNIIIFVFLATLFVMVFFFPATAGEIGGKIVNGFLSIINRI
jgi:hypothetical protein